MTLFARNLKSAPPVPAKRVRNGVTNGELKTAIAAVCEGLHNCTTRDTLDALWDLTNDAPDDAIVAFEGAAPVTCAQLDAALDDAKDFELPTGTLGPLKRVRELLVRAEERAASVAAEMVTRAEFDGLADAVAIALVAIADLLHDQKADKIEVRLDAAARSAEFESASAGIRALLTRIDKASRADDAWKRRGAVRRPQVYPGASTF